MHSPARTHAHTHTHTCALVSPPTAQAEVYASSSYLKWRGACGRHSARTPVAEPPEKPRQDELIGEEASKGGEGFERLCHLKCRGVPCVFSPTHTCTRTSITSKALCWCCVLHHLDAASRRRLVQRSRFSSHVNGSVCARTRVVVSSSSPSSSHHVAQFSCA